MHCCVPVDVIAQHVKCPRGVSRLHAPDIYTPDPAHVVDWDRLRLTRMGPLRRDQGVLVVAVIRFCNARP